MDVQREQSPRKIFLLILQIGYRGKDLLFRRESWSIFTKLKINPILAVWARRRNLTLDATAAGWRLAGGLMGSAIAAVGLRWKVLLWFYPENFKR